MLTNFHFIVLFVSLENCMRFSYVRQYHIQGVIKKFRDLIRVKKKNKNHNKRTQNTVRTKSIGIDNKVVSISRIKEKLKRNCTRSSQHNCA